MKIVILYILIFTLSNNIGFSQELEWAPIGAKWYHLNFEQIVWLPVVSESVKDTIVKDIKCRKIVSTFYEEDGTIRRQKNLFTYENDDIIYYYGTACDSFLTLYNFRLQEGIEIDYFSNNGNEKYEVNAFIHSISTRELVSGQQVNFYKIRPSYVFDENGNGSGYYQFIGADGAIFLPPLSNTIPGFVTRLSCYKYGESEYRFMDRPCDLLTNIQNILVYPISLKIYPTILASNKVINFDQNLPLDMQIWVSNLGGQMERLDKSTYSSRSINLSHLPKGVYVLKFRGVSFSVVHKVLIL